MSNIIILNNVSSLYKTGNGIINVEKAKIPTKEVNEFDLLISKIHITLVLSSFPFDLHYHQLFV